MSIVLFSLYPTSLGVVFTAFPYKTAKMGRNRKSSEGKQTLLEEPMKDYGTEANTLEEQNLPESVSAGGSAENHLSWNYYVISKVICLFVAIIVAVSTITPGPLLTSRGCYVYVSFF